MMFTVFDIIIFTIIGVSTIMGLHRGLLGIAINLIGFIASIVVAIFLFPDVKSILINYIENSLLLPILSGTVAYTCSLFTLMLFTSKISSMLSVIGRGFFDRTLGALVGFIRGVLISTLIFALTAISSSGSYLKAENAEDVICNINAEKYPLWLSDSKTTGYLEKSLNKLISFLPQDTLKSIKLPSTKLDADQDIVDTLKSKKEKDHNSSDSTDAILKNNTQELKPNSNANDF